jgi:glutamine---fructose-6-phosphate transaminase (isomerizing)
MCGIVGYIGAKDAVPLLRDGLKRLEYRGYDSAGLAIMNGHGVEVMRSLGKIANLDQLLNGHTYKASVGLGHTRWATHGKPSVENAHPHADCTAKIAVVHNGIIENYSSLKQSLEKTGHKFRSETDTEVLAHLIEEKLCHLSEEAHPDNQQRFLQAIRQALLDVCGAYALAVLWSEMPDMIVAAKTASPLVIGVGENETFVASDVPAFLEHTRNVLFLEDGELAVLGKHERTFFRLDGQKIEKTPVVIPWDQAMAQKAGYRHFMLKEIHEQPDALERTLRGRLGPLNDGVMEREAGMSPDVLRAVKQVHLVACGTSYHAGLAGRYLLERYARVPAQVEIASEFRYRHPILDPSTLVIAISQSGETADTLAAVKLAREYGAKVLAISNTVGSAIARASDYTLYTRCGPECGVASTKAFIGQLAALNLFALHLSATLGTMAMEQAEAWAGQLARLPELLKDTLQSEERVRAVAESLVKAEHCLFLGRGLNFPTALEGALKLKEISYIHAEGYAAGEMKHGPIALIDQNMPVVSIATRSPVFEKILSNMEEARSRGARLIAVCNRGDDRLHEKVHDTIEVPDAAEFVSPIINIVPLQLMAYHVADLRGCDVDQPRNLAKSVTVE